MEYLVTLVSMQLYLSALKIKGVYDIRGENKESENKIIVMVGCIEFR